MKNSLSYAHILQILHKSLNLVISRFNLHLIYNERARLLFCLWNPVICDILVAVSVEAP